MLSFTNYCRLFLKNFLKNYFILKLSSTNHQPPMALFKKRLCNILNKSLLTSPFTAFHSPSTPFLQEIFATFCIFLFYYSLFSPRIQSQRHFCKRFLQHVAFFSSKFAFFFPTFTINTISARDFCNMLYFSLLNLPFYS